MRYTTEYIRKWLDGEVEDDLHITEDFAIAYDIVNQLLADLELAESTIAAENAINIALTEELEKLTDSVNEELSALREKVGKMGLS